MNDLRHFLNSTNLLKTGEKLFLPFRACVTIWEILPIRGSTLPTFHVKFDNAVIKLQGLSAA